MKRFRRWLFNVIAAVSFVLLLASFSVLLRSSEFIAGTPSHWLGFSGDLGFDVAREGIYIEYGRASRPEDDWHKLTGKQFPLGFAWDQEQTDVRVHGALTDSWINFIVIPYWFIAALTTPIPLMWATRLCCRRDTIANSLCCACGYDLRATPERCPECGTIPRKNGAIST